LFILADTTFQSASTFSFLALSKLMDINLPNRDELSFLNVLALPKDSKTGFVRKICCSIV